MKRNSGSIDKLLRCEVDATYQLVMNGIKPDLVDVYHAFLYKVNRCSLRNKYTNCQGNYLHLHSMTSLPYFHQSFSFIPFFEIFQFYIHGTTHSLLINLRDGMHLIVQK